MYVEPDSTLVLPPAGSEMRTWLDAAQAACDAADVIALRHFRQHLHIEEKPDRSFVTQADRAIEEAIRARLTAAFPQHGLVGEEYGTQEGAHPVRWIIDPIDGTHNYMRGVPLFGTLLGLEVEGVLVLGVLSAPALGHRWFAWSGGGAWEAAIANGTWDPATAARLRVYNLNFFDLNYTQIALTDSYPWPRPAAVPVGNRAVVLPAAQRLQLRASSPPVPL